MSPSKARANEVETTPATNDIVLFRYLQHERERPGINESIGTVTRHKEKGPS